MKLDLAAWRQLLQDESQTACLVVTIAKWMSLLETKRFTDALKTLRIPFGELVINQVLPTTSNFNRYAEQHLIAKFIDLVELKPALISFQQPSEPVGKAALDRLMTQTPHLKSSLIAPQPIYLAEPISIGLSDFITLWPR